MSAAESIEDQIEVAVSNVGGIDATDVSLRPGVNVLTGRNATNRTSFLQAIMAALGSDRPSLKGDADEGFVELAFGDDTYTRSLERQNGTVSFGGDPYLTDEQAELADLFAFLLESNEARRAVGRGDDLRELIMRPIDTDEIQAQIQLLEAEKRDLDDRIDELEQFARELPGLEEQNRALADEIEALEADLADVEAELETLDADLEESQSQKDELEETFSRLRAARKELETIEYDLETERESRRELERERERLEDEYDEFTNEEFESADRLEGRIQELRERKRSLETTVSELQGVIRFNEERLEDGGIGLEADDDGDVTDQLLADTDEIVCWTCGSEVDRDRIETTLERLRSLHQDKLSERNELQRTIDDLSSRQKERREKQRRLDDLKRRLATIDTDLEAHDDRIAKLEERRDEKLDAIAELEAETERFEGADYSDVLETHRRANELELTLEQKEAQRAEVADQIADLEKRLDEREELEARREDLEAELTELRTRVDRIEREAVEAFNEHMESILAVLEYANIERIWIERRERTVREGRRTVSRSAFDLHVVRTSEEGATYEDTIDHLSESEREVTGLVFTLAGYLVHDVYDVVPFMLLDSLEAIDSERIADLVEYFEEFVDCLVVALLPEDAQALSDEHHYVTEI
ncbi:archaea-specific SMC-related protein [Natronobeatus ordinarius]|uniref:archaea-specific SMC-related protein n=1 Tax=Natronobeatus ordinarius TaxID=2963433 RepID=UPI0020CD375E|nr:archaea-specific SMC-related protein [Natronobeatus ordinarius]